jgi:hypothetical protein
MGLNPIKTKVKNWNQKSDCSEVDKHNIMQKLKINKVKSTNSSIT